MKITLAFYSKQLIPSTVSATQYWKQSFITESDLENQCMHPTTAWLSAEIRACIISSSPLLLEMASMCWSWTAKQGSQRCEPGDAPRSSTSKDRDWVKDLKRESARWGNNALFRQSHYINLFSFLADVGCKIHYFTEKDSLVTTEIKQYPIKDKETYVQAKVLFISCIMASLFLYANFILLLMPFI